MKTRCKECGEEIPRHRRFCDIDCKALFQERARPVTKEWLVEQYVEKGRTANDIAKEVNRDPKSVWTWLKKWGIETRPRGSYLQNRFPKGHASFTGKSHTEETKEKIRQARIREGSVPYLQNGQHWLKGKPRGTVAAWKGGITPERQAFYATPEWAVAVKAVWKRDDAKCQRCGKDSRIRDGVLFHIHHIASFQVKELRHEVSNLVLLCAPCHRWVHSKGNTNKEFLQ